MPQNNPEAYSDEENSYKKKSKVAARMRNNMAAEGYSEEDIKYAVNRYLESDSMADEELNDFVKRAKGKKNASK